MSYCFVLCFCSVMILALMIKFVSTTDVVATDDSYCFVLLCDVVYVVDQDSLSNTAETLTALGHWVLRVCFVVDCLATSAL